MEGSPVSRVPLLDTPAYPVETHSDRVLDSLRDSDCPISRAVAAWIVDGHYLINRITAPFADDDARRDLYDMVNRTMLVMESQLRFSGPLPQEGQQHKRRRKDK